MLILMWLITLGLAVDPKPSFLVGAKQIQKYNGERTTQTGRDYFGKVQVSFGLNATYVHESGLEVFAEYDRGLTNLSQKGVDQKIFNNSINVGLRYPTNGLVAGFRENGFLYSFLECYFPGKCYSRHIITFTGDKT